jgi:hypothetical protein
LSAETSEQDLESSQQGHKHRGAFLLANLLECDSRFVPRFPMPRVKCASLRTGGRGRSSGRDNTGNTPLNCCFQ